jgi:hypothetical protein
MLLYARARTSRFFVDALALAAVFFVLTTLMTTLRPPLSWPGPVDPWASPEDRGAANETQYLWVEDFNAKGFDPRYLPQVAWPDSLLRQYPAFEMTLEEMIGRADLVFVGGVRELSYAGIGEAQLTFVPEGMLAGPFAGDEIVLDNRLGRPFQIDPLRNADGSIVSGRGVLRVDPLHPPVFEGDRVVVLALQAVPSHGEPFLTSWGMPYFPVRLGRVQAPAYPEIDGMHLEDFVAYLQRHLGPRPLYR